MQEKDEQAETFNQDQQEMFQNPDANLGETRPRTPGAHSAPPAQATVDDDKAAGDVANRKLDNPDLL